MLVPVYDILDCGPRSRFVANGKLVHNSESINLQNLPSRGPDAKKIKKTFRAPEGYTIIDCDSSQIEARILAWWAEQDDLTEAFRQKKDSYRIMASAIYGVPADSIAKDSTERQVGKGTVLGCGFGMGGPKFRDTLRGQYGVTVDTDEATRIVGIYREQNPRIVNLWKECGEMLRWMVQGRSYQIGRQGVVRVDGAEKKIWLPSGLPLRYDGLTTRMVDSKLEYVYDTRNGQTRVYGAKVVENVVQALARCVVGEQMLEIQKRYAVRLTVHDSVITVVRDEELDEAKAYIVECMSRAPAWAEGLPVACEAASGKTYGDC